jgi:hypothetical protein
MLRFSSLATRSTATAAPLSTYRLATYVRPDIAATGAHCGHPMTWRIKRLARQRDQMIEPAPYAVFFLGVPGAVRICSMYFRT